MAKLPITMHICSSDYLSAGTLLRGPPLSLPHGLLSCAGPVFRHGLSDILPPGQAFVQGFRGEPEAHVGEVAPAAHQGLGDSPELLPVRVASVGVAVHEAVVAAALGADQVLQHAGELPGVEVLHCQHAGPVPERPVDHFEQVPMGRPRPREVLPKDLGPHCHVCVFPIGEDVSRAREDLHTYRASPPGQSMHCSLIRRLGKKNTTPRREMGASRLVRAGELGECHTSSMNFSIPRVR